MLNIVISILRLKALAIILERWDPVDAKRTGPMGTTDLWSHSAPSREGGHAWGFPELLFSVASLALWAQALTQSLRWHLFEGRLLPSALRVLVTFARGSWKAGEEEGERPGHQVKV